MGGDMGVYIMVMVIHNVYSGRLRGVKCMREMCIHLRVYTHTWVVVKIMVPCWIPIILRPLVLTPKRDHNFDNHPHR